MTGNLQADGAQSRQTLFVRYCPKAKLLFFRRRFFLDPEDHAKQTGQQLRALDNNDFHMKLLSNIHVICHRHTFRVLCPQYIHFSKKGAEKRPEDFWLPNAFPAALYKAALHVFRFSAFACFVVSKRSACRSPIYFSLRIFFSRRKRIGSHSFCFFLLFFFCFSVFYLCLTCICSWNFPAASITLNAAIDSKIQFPACSNCRKNNPIMTRLSTHQIRRAR